MPTFILNYKHYIKLGRTTIYNCTKKIEECCNIKNDATNAALIKQTQQNASFIIGMKLKLVFLHLTPQGGAVYSQKLRSFCTAAITLFQGAAQAFRLA